MPTSIAKSTDRTTTREGEKERGREGERNDISFSSFPIKHAGSGRAHSHGGSGDNGAVARSPEHARARRAAEHAVGRAECLDESRRVDLLAADHAHADGAQHGA